MRGYLIDTNHIGAIFREDAKVMKWVNAIPPENYPRVCAITLGEIEAGHLINETTDQSKQDEFVAFVNEYFLRYALEVSFTTRISYAEIIGRILKKHPLTTNKKTERHLVEIGVDINDVWIAAVAHEHKMVLVTDDKMTKIREVLEPSEDLKFQNWLK